MIAKPLRGPLSALSIIFFLEYTQKSRNPKGCLPRASSIQRGHLFQNLSRLFQRESVSLILYLKK